MHLLWITWSSTAACRWRGIVWLSCQAPKVCGCDWRDRRQRRYMYFPAFMLTLKHMPSHKPYRVLRCVEEIRLHANPQNDILVGESTNDNADPGAGLERPSFRCACELMRLAQDLHLLKAIVIGRSRPLHACRSNCVSRSDGSLRLR